MTAYYNENDKYCAQWLRNLIAEGLIAPGEVDDRSIVDVQPSDLKDFVQCHFFAGIAGWSYALRLAGWSDDRPVWTGSCPCQPLSSAGQRKGHADERHLWPAFYRLISECKPSVVFGEQVASKDGREWFSGVRADLEALGYAIGAADLCAASLGAPHIRQRLWFVADSSGKRVLDEGYKSSFREARVLQTEARQWQRIWPDIIATRSDMAHADNIDVPGLVTQSHGPQERQIAGEGSIGFRGGEGHWRLEPNVGRVANGVPARVGKLRAFGNAIVPQVAAEFIKAAMEL